MTIRKTLKKWIYRYTPGLAGRFPYFGTRVHFPPHALIWDILCEQGIYDDALRLQIRSTMQPGAWFFDVGSNIGLMSVHVLSEMKDSRVLSFEPSPNTRSYLQKTWDGSPWKDRWTVNTSAVADRVGETSFSISPQSYAGFDGIMHTGRQEKVATVVVPMTTLDEEWKALGRPRVCCIKMDIEGAEGLALSGAKELVKAERPHIFLEWYEPNFAPFGGKAEAILEYAAEFQYDVIAMPSLSVILSASLLRMQMQITGDFALVPREAKVGPASCQSSS
jgi:FkbM family methyltransferase